LKNQEKVADGADRRNEETDVVVVGGGPGGSTLATLWFPFSMAA
jgi:hypothetical protein